MRKVAIIGYCLQCDDEEGFSQVVDVEQKGSHITIYCKSCHNHMMIEFENYSEVQGEKP